MFSSILHFVCKVSHGNPGYPRNLEIKITCGYFCSGNFNSVLTVLYCISHKVFGGMTKNEYEVFRN
jgi:hypothetical protein